MEYNTDKLIKEKIEAADAVVIYVNYILIHYTIQYT